MTRRTAGSIQPPTVSMQDVAAAAGVSLATVSRVLNTPNLVAPATCARVRDAINRLGYVPNVFARGLTRRASSVLGIVLPDFYGEVCSLLLRGADAEARKHDYQVMVTSAVPRGDALLGRSSAAGLVEGMAILRASDRQAIQAAGVPSWLPTVVLDCEAEGVDRICVDHAAGVREAIDHLLPSCKRVCLVAGPVNARDSQRTHSEFVTAMRERGIRASESEASCGPFTEEWGRNWARDRARAGTLRGTGVLAGNDEIALGVLRGAQEAGLSVPGDVKIVGFDDTRICALAKPSISSVRIPLAEIGRAAVRLLLARINDPLRPAEMVRLPATLVARESSTSPR